MGQEKKRYFKCDECMVDNSPCLLIIVGGYEEPDNCVLENAEQAVWHEISKEQFSENAK